MEQANKSLISRIEGLSEPQQKERLLAYCKRLASDKERLIFDAILKENAMDLVRPERLHWFKKVLKHYKDIEYTRGNYCAEHMWRALGNFSKPKEQWKKPFTWSKSCEYAVKVVSEEFANYKLSMLNYKDDQSIGEVLPRKSTSAGFLSLETGFRSKGENLKDIFSIHKEAEERAVREGNFNIPILIASRNDADSATDGNGDWYRKPPNFKDRLFKVKTRLVSMVDMRVIISELRFAKPIQDLMSTMKWYAGGKDFRKHIRPAIREFRRYRTDWCSVDYSAFDQSIPGWLIRLAFSVIKPAFMHDSNFREDLWNVVIESFIHKAFVAPDGSLVLSHNGVPSGSMFTQIIDSVVNRIMVLSYLHAKGYRNTYMMIMGDDNILFTTRPIDLNDMGSYLEHNYGIVVNASKSSFGSTDQHPTFLSREWRLSGEWRSDLDLVSHMFYPERYRFYENFDDWKACFGSYYREFEVGMDALFVREKILKEVKPYAAATIEKGKEYGSGSAVYQRLYTKLLAL